MVNEQTLNEWQSLQAQLKRVKSQEMALRKQICQELFAGRNESVKTIIGDFEVNAKFKTSLKIDEAVFDAISDDLTIDELSAIKMKPSVIVSKFKKLDEDSTLMECIIEKVGAPTLSVSNLT